ncbi:hypothetical protein NBRC116590_02770 [Pelagimonas sp. KU-00592-HH]
MELAIRKIALEMFSRVVLRSPVDTGRFRGNWQVAIGSVPTGTLDLDDKSGQATLGKVQAAALGLQVGDTITLVNNLPYGPRLENGHSGQAPNGMVGLTVQEFHSVVQEIGLELVQL